MGFWILDFCVIDTSVRHPKLNRLPFLDLLPVKNLRITPVAESEVTCIMGKWYTVKIKWIDGTQGATYVLGHF